MTCESTNTKARPTEFDVVFSFAGGRPEVYVELCAKEYCRFYSSGG